MDWNHLPNAGGIYAQSPRLLDRWMKIWRLEDERQKKEQAQHQFEMNKGGGTRRRR